MKWWAIHTNLPLDVVVKLPHPRRGHSQNHETPLAHSADKPIPNYHIECSSSHPSVSTLRPKGFSRSRMKYWAIYTNFPMDAILRSPHPRSGNSQGQETFSEPSADKQTHNYDIECSNHHPSLSRLRLQGLIHRKMKGWVIHTNLPVVVIIRLPHPRGGDSRNKETSLAPSADEPTGNHDIECSNHHPSLSRLRVKGLIHRKMKWWVIHTNLPVDVIIRLPHPRGGDSRNDETSLAPSADEPTGNYDIECSNDLPSLSTIRPRQLSRSKMKWWAIYTNLPMDVMVRLPHRRSWNSLGQETFLAPSADRQTRNYDIECSNHHPSLSTLSPMGLSHSKMKWWATHTNIPVDVIVKLPHSRSGDSQGHEKFSATSADKETLNYDIEWSNHHPSL